MANALIIVAIVGIGMLVLNFMIWKVVGGRRARQELPRARSSLLTVPLPASSQPLQQQQFQRRRTYYYYCLQV